MMQLDIPIFGICLGHQIMSLAYGLEIEKMPFGHHGANHPVHDLKNNIVFITSQNHNFAVAEPHDRDDINIFKPKIVNIGSGQGTTIYDFAKKEWDLLKAKGKILYIDDHNNISEIPKMVADIKGLNYK